MWDMCIHAKMIEIQWTEICIHNHQIHMFLTNYCCSQGEMGMFWKIQQLVISFCSISRKGFYFILLSLLNSEGIALSPWTSTSTECLCQSKGGCMIGTCTAHAKACWCENVCQYGKHVFKWAHTHWLWWKTPQLPSSHIKKEKEEEKNKNPHF